MKKTTILVDSSQRNTTMNPINRTLKQVTILDAAKADQVFTMLMGDEVMPRKHFIQTHAKSGCQSVLMVKRLRL